MDKIKILLYTLSQDLVDTNENKDYMEEYEKVINILNSFENDWGSYVAVMHKINNIMYRYKSIEKSIHYDSLRYLILSKLLYEIERVEDLSVNSKVEIYTNSLLKILKDKSYANNIKDFATKVLEIENKRYTSLGDLKGLYRANHNLRIKLLEEIGGVSFV